LSERRAWPRPERAMSLVIIVAVVAVVSITLAVATSFWMGGILGYNVEFERWEIRSVKTIKDGYGNWKIAVEIRNTGTSAVTLMCAFVNGLEVAAYDASEPIEALSTCTTNMTTAPTFTIQSGQTRTINIWVGANYSKLLSGTTVNIRLQSSGGYDCMKLVILI